MIDYLLFIIYECCIISIKWWVISDISPCREMFYKSSWFSRTVIARKRSDRGNPEDWSTSDCIRVILRLCRRISRKGKPCRLNITPSSMAKCWTLSFECWVLSDEWWVMSDEWWVIYLPCGRCFSAFHINFSRFKKYKTPSGCSK